MIRCKNVKPMSPINQSARNGRGSGQHEEDNWRNTRNSLKSTTAGEAKEEAPSDDMKKEDGNIRRKMQLRKCPGLTILRHNIN